MTASIDEARVLRGADIAIDDIITVRQPTLNEIVNVGERKFFSEMYSFCAIPSDMKSVLDDAGIDFMETSDWSLFLMLSRNMSYEITSLVIPNIDFAKLDFMQVNGTDEVVLSDGNSTVITEAMYSKFIPYVRALVGYTLKREKAANKFTKQVLIDEDRNKRKEGANKPYESTLNPMIISLVNTEEFTYDYSTVYDLTFFQLFRSFIQIQKKKSACALYQGSMSGFVDTSKIKKSSFSWIYEKEQK